ncbi:MAG: c-type cytochrome [Rubricoccaceae bacterium]
MRHVLANLAVYLLAALLLVVSGLFAWVRSAQLVLTDERAVEPVAFEGQVVPAEDVLALGERVYVANCQNCHAADGRGLDVYPPVVGQEAVYRAEGGPEYLVRLTLYGLHTGMHPAPMPPMPNLSDAQVAAVYAFVLDRYARQPLGLDAPPLAPEDVARERGQRWRERDIGPMRPAVPAPAVLAGAG